MYEKIGFQKVEEIWYFRYSMPTSLYEKKSLQDGRDHYNVFKEREIGK